MHFPTFYLAAPQSRKDFLNKPVGKKIDFFFPALTVPWFTTENIFFLDKPEINEKNPNFHQGTLWGVKKKPHLLPMELKLFVVLAFKYILTLRM